MLETRNRTDRIIGITIAAHTNTEYASTGFDHVFACSHASIQSEYTSTGSLRVVMDDWKSSRHTRHEILPTCRSRSIRTSHVRS